MSNSTDSALNSVQITPSLPDNIDSDTNESYFLIKRSAAMLGSQRDVILGDGKIKDNSTWKINKPSFSSKVKTPSSKWYRMLDRGTNTHQDHPLEKATISPTITNK